MTKNKTQPVSTVQKHSNPRQAILGKWLRRALAVAVLGASLALSSSSHAVDYTANEFAIRGSIEPAKFGTFASSMMGYLETLQTDAEKKLFLDQLNPILSTAMAMNSQFSVNRFAGSMNREMNRRDPARGCSPCDAVGCGQSNRLNSWYEGFGEYLH